MRNNVETRRCGCGLILGLREGCQRCADAARARLHAQGVAFCDGAFAAAQDEARTRREFARAKPLPTPAECEIARLREYEAPPVGAEVDYDVALADMKARPEARYRSSIESGTYRFDGRLLYWPESGGVFDSRNSEGFNRTMHWTRLPDATTVAENA